MVKLWLLVSAVFMLRFLINQAIPYSAGLSFSSYIREADGYMNVRRTGIMYEVIHIRNEKEGSCNNA